MNSVFYAQDIFSSPYEDQCQNLLNLDGSLLDFNKLDYPFYPTPNDSPLNNEFNFISTELVLPQQDQQIFKQPQQPMNDMMMVPPLNFTEPMAEMFEHKAIDIDLVDRFIAEHEAALNFPEKMAPPMVKETNWSHWNFVRESSPEMLSDGLSSSKSTTTTNSLDSIPENMVPNKVIKPTLGRRGRGKGVKNKVKKVKTDEPKPKKPVLEGTLYVCQHDNCGKSFTRPYNLTSHMRTHSSERPYACSHCERKFARQHDRNRHEKLHWGIRPYACHHCHKSFARMDALNRHLRMENGCTGIHL